ncbi:glycosyltransferase [Sphingobacterium sp. UBA5670]|uniref:glycosyltransferase n=1 Tax=Sphingobacterium sp. UBA5670 TaxID=1947502 RepID=UPI0025D7C08C|nr:glycosyltransferase [Sphingobacterium sp. UBA5670]
MKKQLAFISDHASPLATLGGKDSGGQNVYVAEVATQLALMGYQIDIYTRAENQYQEQIVYWKPNIRVVHILAGPIKELPKEELYGHMEEFSTNMIDFITENQLNYHLVHAHFWLSGLVAMEVKKQLKIPFVITFHALGAVRRMHQGCSDKFPKVREKIEKDIIWAAERIIAECPNDLKDLIQHYQAPQDKIEIIPCGYNPSDFHPIDRTEAKDKLGLDPSFTYILQLGRMVRRKGIDNVIEAFSHAQHALPELRLLVVGGNFDSVDDRKEYEYLQHLCTELNIEDKVIFTGQKDRDKLKYFYAASELFITTPWYEPFGITPLESMACGTPVIGADVGGISFTVRHEENGILVPPQQPQQLSSAIIELVSNDRKRLKFSVNALRHVKSFTWKTITESIARLYEQCLPKTSEKEAINQIKQSFIGSSRTFEKAAEVMAGGIARLSSKMVSVLRSNRKIMICGNGGSAAESQHFAAELVGRFEIPHRPGYPVISLNTDVSVMTAWANDFGYETVFSRQVQALGQSGDMLICLSTSGNSANIINALKEASKLGIFCANLLGHDGGEAAQYGEYNLIVPSDNTARIQEVQLHIIHQLCALVEQQMVAQADGNKRILVQKKLIA